MDEVYRNVGEYVNEMFGVIAKENIEETKEQIKNDFAKDYAGLSPLARYELNEAIEVIEAKRKADAEKLIKIFDENPDYQILNGRWGPYLKAGKKNVRIPKDKDPASLTYQQCVELVENTEKSGTKKKSRKKK